MRTLLVLEDEPAVMKFLVHILKQHRIVAAATAEEALQLFADLNFQLDLLVADLSGPRMSGIRVAMLLRVKLPELPVILTSGYPSSAWSRQDSGDLLKLGSQSLAIIQKPFQSQLLVRTASDLMENAPVDSGEDSRPRSIAGTAGLNRAAGGSE